MQVIGAGRGVGREIALQLCQLGVKVACVDKNDKMCRATVQLAARDSVIARPYICDITDKEQVCAFFYGTFKKNVLNI